MVASFQVKENHHPSIVYILAGFMRGGDVFLKQPFWHNLDRLIAYHRATPRQDKTNNHACTPKGNLERPINLTCIVLDGGRKPEYLERTHTCMVRTCKQQKEPRTFSLHGNSTTNCANVDPLKTT
ncbi:hypothetical protein CHARACLAT_015792 [Characodon lateralis]|uniref:Uncharacterized protein n=1 Tax=Characodon lateralis TaxID=208331 RepID=A0ABU7DGZ1_9TELE|nr:hypothetical protein [Characodon lateralis]